MSLQVWMPLTQDLRNQGISTNKATNSGATFQSSGGKLGGCYKSDGEARFTIPTYSWMTLRPENSFSVALWEKGTATSTTTYIFACTAFELRVLNSTIYVGWGGAANEPARYNATISDSTWYHIAFTWDGPTKTLKLYINGTLQGTSNVTGSVPTSISSNLYCTHNGTRYLNDLRIYNHCLTASEVKEISKGLVLHYTLGSESVLPAITNYCSNSGAGGWNNSGAASRSGNDTTKGSPLGQPVYSITTTTAGEQCITFGNPDVTNLKGKQVTASCWIYIVGSTIYNSTPYLRSSKYDNVIASFKYEGNGSINTWPKNKWIRVSGTGTVASDETGAYFCNYIGNSGEVRYYTGWQVELYGEATPYIAPGTSRSPGIIYDSSGYCRNGTISGTLIPNSDTSRYKNCVRVTGTGKIVYPFPNQQQFTFSLWFKRDRVSQSNREMLGTGWYGLSMELNSDNTLTMRHQLTSGTWDVISTTKFSDTSKWYHIALTRNASGVSKIYVNGVEDKSGTNTNAINYTASTAELFTYADSYQFRGSMSDFRIYATALSADDVKDLYNLGALIS